MKVILNSDVLINLSFAHGTLPLTLQTLCRLCSDREITIVVPHTTLLEFNRRRDEFAERAINEIRGAFDVLDRFSIEHAAPNPEELVARPDLLELLGATGVRVDHVVPTLDDFNDAHQRACMHLAPRGAGKSDEMRDLIIWALSLRTSSEGNGAILVAKDRIFHDREVTDEADKVGLIRIETVSQAVETIYQLVASAQRVRTPGEQAAAAFVETIWPDLEAGGMPVAASVSTIEFSNIQFTQGPNQVPSNVGMRLLYECKSRHRVELSILLDLNDGFITRATLTDILVDGEPWNVESLTIKTERLAPALRV